MIQLKPNPYSLNRHPDSWLQSMMFMKKKRLTLFSSLLGENDNCNWTFVTKWIHTPKSMLRQPNVLLHNPENSLAYIWEGGKKDLATNERWWLNSHRIKKNIDIILDEFIQWILMINISTFLNNSFKLLTILALRGL